ncbi:Protein CBP3 [Lachnellula suecica]|uniref:Protein CBP3 n=1 Tax=Lachnellula suecica TaxID=602035 RepID=A0A8T9CHP1_9HELO|nr:Protein CBP3 [Lachnellula suecica]
MASKTCLSCLRALQRQARFVSQSKQPISRFATSRAFTTSRRRNAEIPGSDANPNTSVPPVTSKPIEGSTASTTSTAAQISALSKKGGVTGTYTAYGATEVLYKECARHADYKIPQAGDGVEEVPKTEDGEDLGVGEGWWHTGVGLQPTFSTWSQVTMLHLYLLTVRFRCFEPSLSKIWLQHLTDHFFSDAENKMALNHGMVAQGTRNKYLKDMYVQWRGLQAAYDEGIAKNDAVLAAAVWRNVFKASEDVDIKKLAQIVSYMRRTLAGLDEVDDLKVMEAGMVFGSPETEGEVVALKSKMMDSPFSKTPEKPLPAKN